MGVPVGCEQLLFDLMSVETPAGIQASNAHLYKGAVFGRDSAIVGLDVVGFIPSLAERVLVSLAARQGRVFDQLTEEEPGRIHHELRTRSLGSEIVGLEQQAIMAHLAQKWGGTSREVCYYGSVDATPRFIQLVAAYVRHHGSEILDVRVEHHDGTTLSLRDATIRSIGWLMTRLGTSSLGLLEFKRQNPRGIANQVLRDSGIAYVHADGTLPNHHSPIASLEAQAIAYDALLDAAELFPGDVDYHTWIEAARHIRATTLKLFAMEDDDAYAMALDRDPHTGAVRQVATHSSLPAELLDSRLFLDGSDESARIVAAIIRRMYGPDFLTDVGIRMRSFAHAELIGYYDYQGSHVSWVVNSGFFARGLRRHGFSSLASDMEDRFLHGIARSGMSMEYWYVDEQGRACYWPTLEAGYPEILGTNLPEHSQAWTISAALHGLMARRQDNSSAVEPWKLQLTDDILSNLASSTVRPPSRFSSGRGTILREKAEEIERSIRLANGES